MEGNNTYEGGIVFTLGFYTVYFLAFTVPWLFIRRRFPDLYFPRCRRDPRQKTVLGWIMPTIKLDLNAIYDLGGRKAVLYMQWKRDSFHFMCALAGISFFLLPVYMYWSEAVDTRFARTAASNLAPDSLWLWLTWCFSLVITMGFLWLIYHYRQCLQQTQILSQEKDQETFHRVVRLTQVPMEIVTNEELLRVVENVSGLEVKEVSIAWNNSQIAQLQKQKLHAHDQWELYQEQEQVEGETVYFHPPSGPCPGALTGSEKVPAVDYWATRMEELKQEISRVHQEAVSSRIHSQVAFIILGSRSDAELMRQNWSSMKKMDNRLGNTHAQASEPHQEILWESLSSSRTMHYAREVVFDVLMGVIAFFWTIPIAFLSNLHNLAQIPVLGEYIDNVLDWNAVATDIVEQLLPVILTWLFHQMLPKFCLFLASNEKHLDLSSLHVSAMKKFWIFVMLNGFVFYLLFSSGIDFAQALVNNPEEIADALRTLDWALYGSFYCTYLLTMALFDSSLGQWRLKDGVKAYAQWLSLEHKTPKRRAAIFEASKFSFHTKFAKESLYFAMIMTFAPIVPLVSLCAVLAYLLNYWVDKSSIALICPRDPALGRKLFMRFGLYMNASMSLTFICWSFFFLSHGNTFLSYLAPISYILLWVGCFVILYRTKREYVAERVTGSTSEEGSEEEEKFYTWEYMASPTRGLNEMQAV